MGYIGAKGRKASEKFDPIRRLAPDRSVCQLTPKLDCLRASRQGPSKPSDRLGSPARRSTARNGKGMSASANRSRTTGCSRLHLRDNKGPILVGMVASCPWARAIDPSPRLLPARRLMREQHGST
jgi:hypothetical protein